MGGVKAANAGDERARESCERCLGRRPGPGTLASPRYTPKCLCHDTQVPLCGRTTRECWVPGAPCHLARARRRRRRAADMGACRAAQEPPEVLHKL